METKIAKIITGLFQPIIVPVYGFLLLVDVPYFYPQEPWMKLLILSIAILSTSIIPTLVYFSFRKAGKITDPNVTNRQERYVLYGIISVLYVSATVLVGALGVPYFFFLIMAGLAMSVTFNAIVTFKWKISAHANAMGGFLGGVLFVTYQAHENLVGLYVALLVLGGLVAFSRLKLKEHTPMQLVFGYIVGLFCVGLFPYLMFS